MITLGDSTVVPLPRSTEAKNGRDRGKVKATKAVRQMEIKWNAKEGYNFKYRKEKRKRERQWERERESESIRVTGNQG